MLRNLFRYNNIKKNQRKRPYKILNNLWPIQVHGTVPERNKWKIKDNKKCKFIVGGPPRIKIIEMLAT